MFKEGAWCTFWEGRWWVLCTVEYPDGPDAAVYPFELYMQNIWLGYRAFPLVDLQENPYLDY